MSRRFSYFTCTILAAGLVAAVGGNIRAEQVEQVSLRKSAGCCEAPCTTATPAPTGCTDSGCAGGCETGCDSGCGLFSGHRKHSWRHADCGTTGGCGSCRGSGYEGLDPHFNCGCNGSYNFPVPPLSTYMWPGMYKHQLMTEYNNPWRFPPIKAYTDEAADVIPEDFRRNYPRKAGPPVIELEDQASTARSATIQPVSARRELPTRSYTGLETMSQKMQRYYSTSNR